MADVAPQRCASLIAWGKCQYAGDRKDAQLPCAAKSPTWTICTFREWAKYTAEDPPIVEATRAFVNWR